MPSWMTCIHAGRHICRHACIYAGRHPCICAGRRAHMQAGHMSRPAFMRFWYACMHASSLHICRQACIYAGRHAYMQNCVTKHKWWLFLKRTKKEIVSIPTGKNAVEKGLIKKCNGFLWFSNKRAAEWGVTDADVGIYIYICIYVYIYKYRYRSIYIYIYTHVFA